MTSSAMPGPSGRISHQAVAIGVVTALVGYGSSVTVVVNGLVAMGATTEQAASGLLALGVTMSVTAVLLSLFSFVESPQLQALMKQMPPGYQIQIAGAVEESSKGQGSIAVGSGTLRKATSSSRPSSLRRLMSSGVSMQSSAS